MQNIHAIPGGHQADLLSNTHKVVIGFSNIAGEEHRDPIVIVRGEGATIYDAKGADYIDASSNFFSATFGFLEPELIEAAEQQMRKIANYSTAYSRATEPVLELAERLAALVPIKNARIGFASSGSEANEFLLKFLMMRNAHRGQPMRRTVIARWGSYHGSTLLTSSLGGGDMLRDTYGIEGADFLNVSQPDADDYAKPGETEEAFVLRLAEELDSVIRARGAERVAAFVAEPISMSSGSAVPPAGYFPALNEVLDRYGIPFIADEVITGFGRFGARFGSEKVMLRPDGMTFAKGINSGFIPLAAFAISEDIYEGVVDAVRPSGFLMHGGTYHGNPVAAAVALKSLELYETRGIAGNVERMGKVLERELAKRAGHPLVRSARSCGLAGSLKFDLGGINARPDQPRIAQRVVDAALKHRLLLRVSGGAINIGPPLVVTEAEIVELFRRFDLALADTFADLKGGLPA